MSPTLKSNNHFFEELIRADRRGRPIKGGVENLLVPALLAGYLQSPQAYADAVNNLRIVDASGDLELPKDKVAKIRENIITGSPALMMQGTDFFVKVATRVGLSYQSVEISRPLKPSYALDYIVGTKAAQEYARRAGICIPLQFTNAELDGIITGFMYKGNTLGLKQMKAYLLDEINSFRRP